MAKLCSGLPIFPMGDLMQLMDDLTVPRPGARREGFRGQRIFFAPEQLRAELARHPLAVGLQAVHLGWFPSAKHHSIHRPAGAPEAVLILCTNGRGRSRVGTVVDDIRAGQVVILPPNMGHSYGADPDEPWSIFWVHFAGTVVAPLLAQLDASSFRLTPPEEAFREMCRLFRRCQALLETGHTLRSALAVSHFLRAIVGCSLFVGNHPIAPRRTGDTNALGGCLQLMQRNPDRSLSLSRLARTVHLSPSRFSAVFRARMGESPGHYHLRLRMQNAARLLDSSVRSVQEIAEACGYSDSYYFSRLFKQIMGLSPRNYRRAVKG
jgi:AraC family transcriptional regulator of arabinose operon